MLQLPPNPPLRLPLDWQLHAADKLKFTFPKIGWRVEDCKTCNGTKVVRTWEGAPLYSDVVEFPCNCVEQMLLGRYLGMRGLHRGIITKGMADLRWLKRETKNKLNEWSEDPAGRARHTSGLIIVGTTHGKTLTASLLQRKLILHGVDSYMVKAQMFNPDGMLFNWKGEDYELIQEFWNTSIQSAPMLVIQRVEGATMITDYGKARIEGLIRHRADNELMTVITTKSIDMMRLALPINSDVADAFGIIKVDAEPYPEVEIREREIQEKITRPVVMA